MTATEELRQMLDERGAKWHTYFVDGAVHTTWNDAACWFTELEDGTTVWGEAMEGSPAQAIEATLGRGECRFEFDQKASDRCQGPVYSCDKCWALSYTGETDKGKFKFCPNCGRHVKR